MATRAMTQQIEGVAEPRLVTGHIRITGSSPYIQHAFSEKSREMMEMRQTLSKAESRRAKEPRDFMAGWEAAQYKARRGDWHGIPAPAFRHALISACRLAGFVMTRAKLSLFILHEGLDRGDGTPLVRIYPAPELGVEQPEVHKAFVRNETGVADIRWRPMWQPGWWASLHLRWDADQLSATDVRRLLLRAGAQVGIGEGRYDGARSVGIGWGCFEVAEWDEERTA